MIFIGLFHRERVYLAMSKGVNQLQNCLKKAVTCIIIIIIVSMVSSTTSALPFCIVVTADIIMNVYLLLPLEGP
jgi:hypothetical protein